MLGLESIAGGDRQLRDKQTTPQLDEQHDDDAQNDQQQLSRDEARDQTPPIADPSLPSPDLTADPFTTTAAAPVSISLAASNAAALDQVRRTATCGICSNLVASSLVLSCGHMFCGSCLFDFLNDKPSCPTCQVSLRAIPVRCLALDGVVEALCRVLTKTELGTYHARVEEGKSVANKLNKMFWWLQPAAIPAVGDAHMQHQGMPGGGSNIAGAAAAAMSGGGPAANSRVRGGSCGGAAAASSTSRHMQPRQSLDSHLACAPQLSHMSQAHLHGNQILPGLLGYSPVGPTSLSHHGYDDMPHQHAGFGHNLAMGSQQTAHQAPAQRHAQAAGFGVPRAPRHQMSQSFNPTVGMQQQVQHGGMQGLDSPSLCNMAALGLTHPLQQMHGMGQQQQLPSSFYDFAQQGQLQQCAPQMQQMAEYPQSVQASSQSEQMASMHAHVQLQNLLHSLSMGDWS